MKQRAKAFIVVCAIMLAAVLSVYAAYDSSSDPLISKSYLEQVFQATIDAKIDELKTTITSQKSTIESLSKTITSQQTTIEKHQKMLDEQTKSLADQVALVKSQKELIDSMTKSYEDQNASLLLQKSLIESLTKSISELQATDKSQNEMIESQKSLLEALTLQVKNQQEVVDSTEAKIKLQTDELAKQEEKMNSLEKKVSDLEKSITECKNTISELEKTIDEIGSHAATYEVVYLERGQKLICNGGDASSVEIILRSGQAKAISQYGSSGTYAQGLSDATTSTEIYHGDVLTKNHLVIVPRGDGRGVQVTSTEAYFLVRGTYEIVTGD